LEKRKKTPIITIVSREESSSLDEKVYKAGGRRHLRENKKQE